MSKKKIFYIILSAVLILAVSAGLYLGFINNQGDNAEKPDIKDGVEDKAKPDKNISGDTGKDGESKPEGVLRGFAAPDIQLESITGEAVKLSDYKESPILINFWYSGSNESLEELEKLQNLNDNLAKSNGLTVIAVNYRESKETVVNFTKGKKYTFKILLDLEQKASEKFKIAVFPTTFLIDANGIISEIWTKPIDEQEVSEKIYELNKR